MCLAEDTKGREEQTVAQPLVLNLPSNGSLCLPIKDARPL